jgi:hypothetical protein
MELSAAFEHTTAELRTTFIVCIEEPICVFIWLLACFKYTKEGTSSSSSLPRDLSLHPYVL